MANILLHQTSYIEIYFDPGNEWLYVDWIGEQTYDTVHDGAMQMLEHLKQERCRKVLNDNTRVTTMWSEAAEWGGRVWFPLMAEAGCEYFAWIYSPNLYSRLSTDLTLQYTMANVIVLTFDDKQIATNWLRQM